MKRRLFLTSGLAAATLHGMEPIARKGQARFQLGLAAYSFRKLFRYMRGEQQLATGWSVMDFIDWCSENKVPGAELTSYFFPPDADAAYCREVRRHAWLRGVTITGTAIGNNWALPPGAVRDGQIADCKKWIDLSVALGAPHIRVFAGSPPSGFAAADAMKSCIAAYQECLDYTADKGVFLGMENHGGLVAKPEGLLEIMKAVKSPWAGVNFDSGNFHTPQPYSDLQKIAPYAINVQLKLRVKPEGDKIGQPTDIPQIMTMLRAAKYQGWFTLEYEEEEDPLRRVPFELAALRPFLS